MAKSERAVSRPALEYAIQVAEHDGPLPNRSKLHEAVSNIYNKQLLGRATDDPEITPSIVGLRIAAWSLESTLKTPKGRAGGNPEALAAGRAARKASQDAGGEAESSRLTKAEIFARDPDYQKSFEIIRKRTPERFSGLMTAVERGSKAGVIKLKCLDCTNFQISEIRGCTSTCCPLYAFRPYQGGREEDETAEGESEETGVAEIEAIG